MLRGADLRLAITLEPLFPNYEYRLIDNPTNAGSMLNNVIMASTYILIATEMSYQCARFLGTLHTSILKIIQAHRRTDPVLVGYLPTMFEEAEKDGYNIPDGLRSRYGGKVLDPIHRSRAIQPASSSGMFSYSQVTSLAWVNQCKRDLGPDPVGRGL